MKKLKVKMAGAVKHYAMFRLIRKQLEKYQDMFDFTVYDGPNLCKWNGGRVNRDITLTPEMVEWYNSQGIGVALTFSNVIVEDVNDPVGNELLEMLNHNSLNSIICVADNLRQYIVDNYPEYTMIFSITGHPNSIVVNDELIAYYKDLESKYDVIVPRFEMPLDPDFYSQVDVSKYEPITNDTCIHGCHVFEEHMEDMSLINRTSKDPWADLGHANCFVREECTIKNFEPDVGREKDREKYGEVLGMDFTEDMYNHAMHLGYRRFKIMGRELPTLELKMEIEESLAKIKEAYIDYLEETKCTK